MIRRPPRSTLFPYTPLSRSKRAQVGQGEGDAKTVSPPQGAQGEPPELEIKGKATKIITELADHLVGNTLGKVIVHAEGAAEPLVADVAVSRHRAEEVERRQTRRRTCGRYRRRKARRAVDEEIGERHSHRAAAKMRSDARVEHSPARGAEIGPEFRVVSGKRRELQNGNDRGKAASLRERESRERDRRLKDVFPRLEHSAERWIEVILFREPQGEQFSRPRGFPRALDLFTGER